MRAGKYAQSIEPDKDIERGGESMNSPVIKNTKANVALAPLHHKKAPVAQQHEMGSIHHSESHPILNAPNMTGHHSG